MGEKSMGSAAKALAHAQGAKRAWVVESLPEALLAVGAVPILGESPVEVADLHALKAARADVLLVADVSVCGPLGCAGVRAGADLAVADLGGSWVVAAGGGVDSAIARALDDAAPADADAALARAGEVHEAWRRASDCAAVVAAYLSCHPLVCAVRYPGLAACEDHHRASCMLVGGFGPYIDYCCGEMSSNDSGWVRVNCVNGRPEELIATLEGEIAP